MRKHRNTYIYRLRGSLGDVALVPAAAHNLAHKYTDTGLEVLHVSNLIAEETSVTPQRYLPSISWTTGASLLMPFDPDAVQRLAWYRFLRRELTISSSRKLCERACTDGCDPKEYRLACTPGTGYDSCLHRQGLCVSGPRLKQRWRNKSLLILAKLTSVTCIAHMTANYIR
jgi:hypothetical protein